MKVYTSYYGNSRKLAQKGVLIVGISIGTPRFVQCADTLKYLAPTRWMLSDECSLEQYIEEYKKILSEVSIDAFRSHLIEISKRHGGKDIALCCYEKPTDFCHRHLLSDWIEEKTGVRIEEFGFEKAPLEERIPWSGKLI